MVKLELRDQSGKIYAFVSKEDQNPWIYIQWIGSIDLDIMKKGAMDVIDLIKKLKCPAILSDRRLATGNVYQINNWMEHKWAPVAIKAGLQYLAHVTSSEAFSLVSSQDLQSRVLGFNFQSFDSLEAAEEWLKEMIN